MAESRRNGGGVRSCKGPAPAWASQATLRVCRRSSSRALLGETKGERETVTFAAGVAQLSESANQETAALRVKCLFCFAALSTLRLSKVRGLFLADSPKKYTEGFFHAS